MRREAARPPAHPSRFTGVKVFGGTVFAQRASLGETVTRWLAAHPEIELVDMVVAQSSDARYHCVSICVFYKGELAALAAVGEVGLDDARQRTVPPAREG